MRRRVAITIIAALGLAATLALPPKPAPAHDPARDLVHVAPAQWLGTFVWRSGAPGFGGLSALHLDPTGTSLTALGDRGQFVTARLLRRNERITGVTTLQMHPILSSKGVPLTGPAADAEGLARRRDGSFCVSFEGVHRIACHRDMTSPGQVLPRDPAFDLLPRNGGFEALALDPTGDLLALPEAARLADGSIPAYRWNGRRWSLGLRLPARAPFRPVAADFGPDGRLYLLERAVALIGFRSQLRRFDIVAGAVRNETLLLQTATGTHDNLEGLSVWRADTGLVASLISDDNLNMFQRTEIVEYRLPE